MKLPALSTLAAGLLCLGCSRGPDPVPEETHGGVFDVPVCGYRVTTRDGATAPRPGQPSLGADPTPFAVHLGIAGDPARTMSVVWRTRDETTLATEVQFGVGDALDQGTPGLTFSYQDDDRGTVRIHEAHLCGLKPGTRYSYRVGGRDGTGRTVWSPVYQFQTAPEMRQNPAAQVLVAVLGDSRGGYASLGQLLRQADAQAPDLVLFSGDAVTFGGFQSEWEDFFAQAEPVLSHVPLLAAHGNHEANAVHYYSQFAFPGNESFYSVDYGPLHLTVLNDTPLDSAEIGGVQRDFLDGDLKAARGAPWRAVMHHMPLWSSGTAHGGSEVLVAAWGPVYDANRPDLVLNGHEHNYERSKPLRMGAPQANASDGTVYVVAGGAGAVLYDVGTSAWTEKSESTRSVNLLRVRPGRLESVAYRDDGTELDRFVLSK